MNQPKDLEPVIGYDDPTADAPDRAFQEESTQVDANGRETIRILHPERRPATRPGVTRGLVREGVTTEPPSSLEDMAIANAETVVRASLSAGVPAYVPSPIPAAPPPFSDDGLDLHSRPARTEVRSIIRAELADQLQMIDALINDRLNEVKAEVNTHANAAQTATATMIEGSLSATRSMIEQSIAATRSMIDEQKKTLADADQVPVPIFDRPVSMKLFAAAFAAIIVLLIGMPIFLGFGRTMAESTEEYAQLIAKQAKVEHDLAERKGALAVRSGELDATTKKLAERIKSLSETEAAIASKSAIDAELDNKIAEKRKTLSAVQARTAEARKLMAVPAPHAVPDRVFEELEPDPLDNTEPIEPAREVEPTPEAQKQADVPPPVEQKPSPALEAANKRAIESTIAALRVEAQSHLLKVQQLDRDVARYQVLTAKDVYPVGSEFVWATEWIKAYPAELKKLIQQQQDLERLANELIAALPPGTNIEPIKRELEAIVNETKGENGGLSIPQPILSNDKKPAHGVPLQQTPEIPPPKLKD